MKTRIAAIIALSLLLPGTALCQTTLDECIRLACKNYPQIKEYELIEASRNYDLNSIATAWIPQVSISGKATWQSDVVEMPFDIQGMNFDIPHDQYGIVADITQQIWDGGATAIRRKLSNAAADAKKSQLEVNLYAIRSRVQNIYLGIILLDKQLELNRLLKDNLSRSLDELDALLQAGVALATDKDQVQVSILGCEQQKTSLETDRKAYVRMLGLLTGSEMGDAGFEEPRVYAAALPGGDVRRPEIKLYETQKAQVALQNRQLNTSFYPRVQFNVQAGYGRPGLNMLSGTFDPYIIAGLKFQWNLGPLYTLKNDRRKLEAETERIDLARRSFLLNTSIEATQKMSEVEKAADIMARDEEIIRLRQHIRENAEHQYREGVIKMNDYLNLLDEEFKARQNGSIHSVQYTMAVLDLQNTLGNDNQ